MKTALTFLFLLLILPFSIAQPYESIFGTNSTQWNMPHGNLGFTGTDQHLVTNDTVINGLTYKTVEGFFSAVPAFKGFLREDLNTGKVWYRNNKTDAEFLIIDLSLEVGDSLFIGGNWNGQPGFQTVDSVFYLNNKKQIRFDYVPHFLSEKFLLMEGLTTNMGFRYQELDYSANFNPKLLCAFKNDIQVYGTGPCIISGIGEELRQAAKLNVYPIPVQDYFNIDFSENQSRVYEYHLTDVLGKHLLQGKFYSNEPTRVDWPETSNGLFFLHIYEPKEKTLVKQVTLVRVGGFD